jgi:alpha-tubulin suppressor-like RCC1 family protein
LIFLGDDFDQYSWGDNYSGQLGDGTNSNRFTPVKINLESAEKPNIGSLPAEITVIQEEEKILTIEASVNGDGTLNYQWY